MQNISPTAKLKNAIQLLEIEQAMNKQLLKKQFHFTYESLKPINILNDTFKDILSSSKGNIWDNVIGLATGYLTKKLVVGVSDNILRKIFGSILQFGVTKVVSQHPEAIKSFAHFIFQRVFHKNEMNSEKSDK